MYTTVQRFNISNFGFKYYPNADLTIEGVEEVMDYLRKGGKGMYTIVQRLKGLSY